MTTPLDPSDLTVFTGSEQIFRHSLVPTFLYTEGVRYFAQNAGNGAYWLLDILATEVLALNKTEEFICIKFTVNDSGTAQITADDGNKNVFWTRDLDFTDTPTGEWKFFLIYGTCLLPSEY